MVDRGDEERDAFGYECGRGGPISQDFERQTHAFWHEALPRMVVLAVVGVSITLGTAGFGAYTLTGAPAVQGPRPEVVECYGLGACDSLLPEWIVSLPSKEAVGAEAEARLRADVDNLLARSTLVEPDWKRLEGYLDRNVKLPRLEWRRNLHGYRVFDQERPVVDLEDHGIDMGAMAERWVVDRAWEERLQYEAAVEGAKERWIRDLEADSARAAEDWDTAIEARSLGRTALGAAAVLAVLTVGLGFSIRRRSGLVIEIDRHGLVIRGSRRTFEELTRREWIARLERLERRGYRTKDLQGLREAGLARIDAARARDAVDVEAQRRMQSLRGATAGREPGE